LESSSPIGATNPTIVIAAPDTAVVPLTLLGGNLQFSGGGGGPPSPWFQKKKIFGWEPDSPLLSSPPPPVWLPA